MDIPKMVTVEECAEITGLSVWSIRRWIKENRFPVVKSGRRVFINMACFVDFLEKGTPEEKKEPLTPIPTRIERRV